MECALNYCSVCAAPLTQGIPPGDHLPRPICTQCGSIHYRNPRMVVGSLPVWNRSVLLCLRAIAPRQGLWTLPAGFMENGESLEQAALRETQEEAGAHIVLDGLYTLYSVPAFNQVYAIYRAQLQDIRFTPGIESTAVRLFEKSDIPWEQLAFETVACTLRSYFSDRQNGLYPVRTGTIDPPRHQINGS
jgi:ADP-ribose pyrophosphatase YjhB (NUDIX family)